MINFAQSVRVAALTSIVACVAAYAGTVSAEGFERSSVISYSDLDLHRQQDVAKLYTRITNSADQLCGPRSLTGIHYKWADYSSCYNDTVAKTVASVAYPTLTAYYQQHSPQRISNEISMVR